MKINSLSIISILSVLTFGSAANAGVIADFYIGGMVGAGGHTLFTKDTHESTASSKLLGAVAGVDIPLVRLEAEYNYLDSNNIDTHIGMLDAYFKVPTTFVQPYLGVGVGMLFSGEHESTDAGVTRKHDINSTAAYQAMLGATIDILTLPLKFDIEGRALYAPDICKVYTPDLLEYNVRLKMRYIF